MLQVITSFFRKNREWRIALPLIAFFFVVNVVIRSVGYEQYHVIHTLFEYGIFLSLWTALFISLVRAKRVILANLSLLLGLWVLAEVICFFLLGMPFRPLYSFPTHQLKNNPRLDQLGYLPDASQVINHHSVVNGDTLFNIHYSIDSLHRRITPLADPAQDSLPRDAYALFLGCSVTYGFGVEDNETIPYYFQQFMPAYRAYNYAYKGYGTQNVLAHLEREEMRSEIPEKEGFAVYVFLWSHINRVIGDMRTYSWGWRLPYYKQSEEGVMRQGNFADDRGGLSGFYEWGLKSHILKYFQVSLPPKLLSHHLELTADIIAASRDRYVQSFGNDRFYVLLHPSDFDWIDSEIQDEMFALLAERNILVLEGYEKVLTLDDAHKVPGDPHPNGLAHKKVASKLAEDLNNQ